MRLPDCSNATLSPQGAHLHPSRRWSLPTGVQGFSSGIPGLSRSCSSAGLSHHTFPPWSQDTFTFLPLPDISASCRLSGPCPPLPSGHLRREMTSSGSCCQVSIWTLPFHQFLRVVLAALRVDCTVEGGDPFHFNTPFVCLLPCGSSLLQGRLPSCRPRCCCLLVAPHGLQQLCPRAQLPHDTGAPPMPRAATVSPHWQAD